MKSAKEQAKDFVTNLVNSGVISEDQFQGLAAEYMAQGTEIVRTEGWAETAIYCFYMWWYLKKYLREKA